MVRNPDPTRLPSALDAWRPPPGAREVPAAGGRRSWMQSTARATGRRPLSDILWEFAEPLLGDPSTWDLREVEGFLSFAIMVWNAVLLEQHEADAGLLLRLRGRVAERYGPQGDDVLHLVDALRRSKIERFGLDRRFIVDFRLNDRGGRFDLRVESADLAAM